MVLTGFFFFFYYCDEEILSTNGILTKKETIKEDNFKNFPVLRTSFRATPSMVFNNSFDLNIEEISDINYDEKEPVIYKPIPENTEFQDFKSQISFILKKRLFLLTMLTQCALYFIITAI